ncbi:MAG: DUF11 domain-containing protein, partial [Desulfobulbaceae bacterium]|nr:DUF11 domain-containing protein [Desulfobulbaceae bacterium]
MPDSVIFSSAAASQGSCSEVLGTVHCALNDLPPYGTETVTITGVPTFVSTITNTVTVSSDTLDPNPLDNTVATNTTVNRLTNDDIMDFPMTLGITELSTNFHINSGTDSITMSGISFDGQTSIKLIGKDGTVYDALDVAINSGSSLDALFDMGLLPEGRYDVQVSNGLGTYVVQNGFEIVLPQPRVEAWLILPAGLRRHGVATIYIEYKNTGNVATPAPMLKLVSSDEDNSDKPLLTLDSSKVIQNFWSATMPPGAAHSVSFLADGNGNSPGVLEVGESGRVPVYYSGLLPPYNMSDTRVEFEVLMIKGDDPTMYGWDDSGYQAEMKPDTIDQTAWGLIYNNLATGVGPTWGDYITTLSENADYLYQHGGKNISDIRKLMQFEMLQAVGHSPVSVLAGGADISVGAPGMPIVFGKYYKNSMIARHTPGPLGMGWTHNWQLSVQQEQNGNVVFNSMNNRSTYVRDSRGGYFSPVGNFSKLSKSGDIFTITAASGMKMVFHPNGTLNYVEDLNHNRITAEYSAELLTRLIHSSGQYLAFNYSGGIIQSITDHTGKLSVQYSYQGEQLSGVVDVAGKKTNYSYLASGLGIRALSE